VTPVTTGLAPLALTVEGLKRAELLLVALRHDLPALPEVRVSEMGRVTLAYLAGPWLSRRAAVDMTAARLRLSRPLVSPETGWYQTGDDAWQVYAARHLAPVSA
jgi:hypothetical protein